MKHGKQGKEKKNDIKKQNKFDFYFMFTPQVYSYFRIFRIKDNFSHFHTNIF